MDFIGGESADFVKSGPPPDLSPDIRLNSNFRGIIYFNSLIILHVHNTIKLKSTKRNFLRKGCFNFISFLSQEPVMTNYALPPSMIFRYYFKVGAQGFMSVSLNIFRGGGSSIFFF